MLVSSNAIAQVGWMVAHECLCPQLYRFYVLFDRSRAALAISILMLLSLIGAEIFPNGSDDLN